MKRLLLALTFAFFALGANAQSLPYPISLGTVWTPTQWVSAWQGKQDFPATTAIPLFKWTTAARPSSPVAGDFGYNTTTGLTEFYNGSAWVSGSGGNVTPSLQYEVPYYSDAGTSATLTGVPNGTAGQVFTSNGSASAPSWQSLTGAGCTAAGANCVGWYNVQHYGMVAGGSCVANAAANTTAFEVAALAAANTSGGVAYFPAGTYYVNTLTVPTEGLGLQGDGPAASFIDVCGTGITPSITSMTYSSGAGGRIAIVTSSATTLTGVGQIAYVTGATTTGSGGTSAVNGALLVAAFTDNQHFSVAATNGGGSGYYGTITTTHALVNNQYGVILAGGNNGLRHISIETDNRWTQGAGLYVNSGGDVFEDFSVGPTFASGGAFFDDVLLDANATQTYMNNFGIGGAINAGIQFADPITPSASALAGGPNGNFSNGQMYGNKVALLFYLSGGVEIRDTEIALSSLAAIETLPSAGQTPFGIHLINVNADSGSPLYRGTGGGTANAQTVGSLSPNFSAYPAYSRTDGVTIQYAPTVTNTGATTLSDGGGALPVVNSSGGALSGGELPAGGYLITLVYQAGSSRWLIEPDLPGYALYTNGGLLSGVWLVDSDAGYSSIGSGLIANGSTVCPSGITPSGLTPNGTFFNSTSCSTAAAATAVNGLSIVGGAWQNNQYAGIQIGAQSSTQIASTQVCNNYAGAITADAGIVVLPNASNVQITGNVIGNCGIPGAAGAANRQTYAVDVQAGSSNNYMITNNNSLSNVTGVVNDNGSGLSKFVCDNVGSGGTGGTGTSGCGSGGAVSSVSAGDSTLTVTPTTGPVTAKINLANANTWSGTQTMGTESVTTLLKIPSTGWTTNQDGYDVLFPNTSAHILGLGDASNFTQISAYNTILPATNLVQSLGASGSVWANLFTRNLSATGTITTGITGSLQCLQANSSGQLVGSGSSNCGGGGGGVSSVTGSGNISVSPTTGSPVVGITATPSFTSETLSSTGQAITLSSGAVIGTSGGVNGIQIGGTGVGIQLYPGSGNSVIAAGSVTPQTTNTYTLGDSSHLWSVIWAQGGFVGGLLEVGTQLQIPGTGWVIDSNDDNVIFPNVGSHILGIGDTTNFTQIDFYNTILPASDNAYSVGQSGSRWAAIWAANGTIQTSDLRDKNVFGKEDLGLGFIRCLDPIRYEWKDGSSPGMHHGLGAQQVEVCLDGEDFAGLYKPQNAVDRYGLNYADFVAPLVKGEQDLADQVGAQHDEIQTLRSEVEALKKLLNDLMSATPKLPSINPRQTNTNPYCQDPNIVCTSH